MANYDGSIRISTKIDESGIVSGLDRIEKSFKRLAGIVGTAFGLKSLVDFGKQAVSIASDLEEVQNVVDTAFGSMSSQVDSWAKQAIKNFGMSELAAKQTASTYMAMSKGMGQYGEDAAAMALAAAERTGDIASFYNMTQEEADTMMKSIWTGETETLKRIGVVMTQTNLDAYALANGIGKTTEEMTQAEQVQLRYQYVMAQTSLAAGDFVKTQDSWANQTRILSQQWNQFLGIMGQGVIQVLSPVLQFLNHFLEQLIVFANTFNAVIGELMGKKQNGQVKQQSQIAVSAGQAADAETKLAGATTKASKAAKGALANFDELNVIQQQTSGGGGSSSIPSVSVPNVSLPSLSELTANGELGENIKISPKLKKALEDIITTIKKFLPLLKGVAAGMLAAFAASKLLSGLSKSGSLINLIAKNLKATKNPLTSVTKGVKEFMSNLSLATKLTISIGGLVAVFVTAQSAVKEWALGSKSLGEVLLNLIPICTAVGVAISLMFPGHAVLSLVVTGITAIIGVLSGYRQAQEELKQQAFDEYFSGVALSAEHLEGILSEMTAGMEGLSNIISEHKSASEELANEYNDAATNLDILYTKLADGKTQVPGSVDAIHSSLMSMSDTLKRSTEEDTTYFYNSWSEIFTNTGTLTSTEQQEILGNIIQLGEDKKLRIDQIEAQITSIHDAAKSRNVNKTVEYTQEELIKLKGFQGELDALMNAERQKEAISAQIGAAQLYNDIKEGRIKITSDTYEELLTTIADNEQNAVTIAKENQKESLTNAEAYWQQAQILYAGNTEELQAAEETYHQMIIQANENYSKSLKDASDISNSTRKIMSENLTRQSQDYEKTKSKLDEYNSLMEENQELEIQSRAHIGVNSEEYEKLQEKIKKNTQRMEELNQEIGDSGTAIKNANGDWTGMNENIKTALDEMKINIDTTMTESVEMFTTYGYDSADGLIKGYESKYDEIKKTAEEMGQISLDATSDALDAHSPSREMEKRGQWAGDGLIEGVKSRETAVVNSFTSLFNKILTKADTFCARFRNGINSLLSNMQTSMNGITVSNGKIIYRSMPGISIPKLAKGAVIPPNQQFMAVLGDQKRGTNLEAPEGLIRKIVREESVSEDSLFRAFSQALQNNSTPSGDLIIQADGNVIGKIAIKTIRSYYQQNGELPFPI